MFVTRYRFVNPLSCFKKHNLFVLCKYISRLLDFQVIEAFQDYPKIREQILDKARLRVRE
jgi:hypothetical protein